MSSGIKLLHNNRNTFADNLGSRLCSNLRKLQRIHSCLSICNRLLRFEWCQQPVPESVKIRLNKVHCNKINTTDVIYLFENESVCSIFRCMFLNEVLAGVIDGRIREIGNWKYTISLLFHCFYTARLVQILLRYEGRVTYKLILTTIPLVESHNIIIIIINHI